MMEKADIRRPLRITRQKPLMVLWAWRLIKVATMTTARTTIATDRTGLLGTMLKIIDDTATSFAVKLPVLRRPMGSDCIPVLIFSQQEKRKHQDNYSFC